MSNKTPEEIKKGLECCVAQRDGRCEEYDECACCPYFAANPSAEDTLTLINQLEAQVPKWISVDVMLPEEVKRDDEEVSSSDLVIVAVRDDMNNIFVSDDILCKGEWVNYSAPLFEVTHWMPLPELPKEDAPC